MLPMHCKWNTYTAHAVDRLTPHWRASNHPAPHRHPHPLFPHVHAPQDAEARALDMEGRAKDAEARAKAADAGGLAAERRAIDVERKLSQVERRAEEAETAAAEAQQRAREADAKRREAEAALMAAEASVKQARAAPLLCACRHAEVLRPAGLTAPVAVACCLLQGCCCKWRLLLLQGACTHADLDTSSPLAGQGCVRQ